MHIENDAGAQRWLSAERSQEQLHTMTKRIPPEGLFEALVEGKSGGFSIDGLVLKRKVIERTGFMDEDLPLHQDSALIFKAAGVAKLMPGSLEEPVAMWRVHDHNRISAPRPKSAVYKMKLKYWYALWKWSRTHLSLPRQNLLSQALIDNARYQSRFDTPFPKRLYGLQKRVQLLLFPFDYPAMLGERFYWRALSAIQPERWFRDVEI